MSQRAGTYLICENPECRKTFYVQRWRVRDGFQARFCCRACRNNVPPMRRKQPKYIFTPEMDAIIRKVYENNTGKVAHARALAKKFNMPRWRVSRRAIEIGAYTPTKKEPDWSEAELRILERFAPYTPLFIQKKLKAAGYHRSEISILLKRKRTRLLSNLKGMSATQCAEFFGIDIHWVLRQIEKGLLSARRRQTNRTEKQGGDIWYIRESALRQFIIENPELIDLRKVEKISFIDLLVNGKSTSRTEAA